MAPTTDMGVMDAFAQRSAPDIRLTLDTLLERVASDPGRWGFTETMLQSASDAVGALGAATTRRAEARDASLAALAALSRAAYGHPDVSAGDLAEIGLSPRPSGSSRPRTPSPATGLVAQPAVDGSVRLSWDRNGNGARAIFQVEAHVDGRGWAIVGATSRSSLTLRNFGLGVPACFRVVATNAGQAARPSAAVAIYGGPGAARGDIMR